MALQNIKYDKMDLILEDINKETIKIDKNEKALLNERLRNVLSQLIDEMCKDPMFDQLFNRVGYTGSYYDGVRVGQATEFDLNLILKPGIKMGITRDRCKPGFIAIKMFDNTPNQWYKTNWESIGYMDSEKVQRWILSIVHKALLKFGNQIDDCKILLSFPRFSPAITLKVNSRAIPLKEISIDLVPVLEFPSSQWPPGICRKSKKILNTSYEDPWFAVPKPPEFWRLSFPRQEMFILKDLRFLKYTLRMIKKVRDELKIDKVASYYIKTLFLWEVERQDSAIWSTTRRGRLFMHMLIKFYESLVNQNISFYWDQKCNLLASIPQEYLRSNAMQLKRFINNIDKLVNLDSKDEIDQYLREKLMSSVSGDFAMIYPSTRSPPGGRYSEPVYQQQSACSLQ